MLAEPNFDGGENDPSVRALVVRALELLSESGNQPTVRAPWTRKGVEVAIDELADPGLRNRIEVRVLRVLLEWSVVHQDPGYQLDRHAPAPIHSAIDVNVWSPITT